MRGSGGGGWVDEVEVDLVDLRGFFGVFECNGNVKDRGMVVRSTNFVV